MEGNHRAYPLIETSRCLRKLSFYFADTGHLAESASRLGLPDKPAIIDKIKNLSLLPWPIQSSILTDTISLAMAKVLESMESDLAIAFVRLFEQLKIGLNKQREILTMVKEIARRDGLSSQAVMAEKPFIEIMTDRKIDRSQKSRQLRAYLRRRRYPRIVAAEKNFESHHKNLNLGNNIKLIPPREFEANLYELNLTFSDLEQLKALQTRLKRIIQHPDFKKIIE